MRSTLIAFDPGPHTGVAVFGDNVLLDVYTLELSRDNPNGLFYQYDAIATLLADEAPSVVVIEGYHAVMQVGRDGIETIKLLGWIHGLAMLGNATVAIQQPAVKKPFLGAAGQTIPRPHNDHELDAIAHGLAYFASHVR